MGGYQAEISYYYAFMLTAYVLRGVSLCVGDVALSGLFIRAKVFETFWPALAWFQLPAGRGASFLFFF